MVSNLKTKKGKAGEVARFISRNKAIKKLQLTIHNFNRLCIIKGIFPIEPKNRIKVQKGDSKYRPQYLKKDIRFLMHDPLIHTMREESLLKKKMYKAKHKKDEEKCRIIRRNKPVYSLSQNVIERYPTFVDAVKDLSDPLTMIFLFSNIVVHAPIKEHHVSRCQRLKWEFMTYVIESRCLTKAFISTRGYYYEVEILGHKIVWSVPHNCVTTVPRCADMKIMRHFLEFYITLVGYTNYHLIEKTNLRYPLKPENMPELNKAEKKDLDNFKNLMVSLNYPLEKKSTDGSHKEEEGENEGFMELLGEANPDLHEKFVDSMKDSGRRKLFEGLKFFIGRENNRESLTFVIKSCGGKVSWPKTVFPCSTYNEDDETITHQIVDRPDVEKKYLSRYYIKPQWVYDCLNAAILKPVQPYFPEADSPPHLSPFLNNRDGWYVPPEEEMFRRLVASDNYKEKEQILNKLAAEEDKKFDLAKSAVTLESDSDDDDDHKGLEVDEDELEENDSDKEEEETNEKKKIDPPMPAENSKEETAEEEKMDVDKVQEIPEKTEEPKREVRRGREKFVNKKLEDEKEARQEKKMKILMMPRANKHLYGKLKSSEVKTERRSKIFKERREAIEAAKAGKMSSEELQNWRPSKRPETKSEKIKKKKAERTREAIKFAKSASNPYRDGFKK